MKFLRDVWRRAGVGDLYRRTAFGRYLDELPAIDPATFWISVALVIALALSIHGLTRGRASSIGDDEPHPNHWIDPPAFTRLAECCWSPSTLRSPACVEERQ